MKCTIELRINGNKVDILNEEAFAQQFSLTYSFSDLSEPDKVTDTYSKAITLPGTPNNNNIFGNIWKLDSNNINKFNPSLLSTFELYLNKELWQSGTVQLQEITRSNNTYTYKVVLYGSVTRVMSLLLNSDIEDDNNKLLRSLNYPNKLKHELTVGVMYQFYYEGDYYNPLLDIHYGDYMNYVPCNNGLYDNFNSSKKVVDIGTSLRHNLQIRDYIWRNNAAASSGDANFDEYSTNEFRVEYQRPAVKMNKLIEQIITDCSTDASINLDSDFFNNNNPYWNNTYLTLSQYNTESNEGTSNGTIDGTYYKYVPTSDTSTSVRLNFTQADGTITIFAPDSSTVVYYGEIPDGEKFIELEFMIKTIVLSSVKLIEYEDESDPVFVNGYYDPDHLHTMFTKQYANTYWTRGKWDVNAEAYAGLAEYGTSSPYTNGLYDASVHSGIYSEVSIDTYNWYINNAHFDGINNNYPNNKYQYTIYHNDIKNNWSSYRPLDDPNIMWKPFKIKIDAAACTTDGIIRLNIKNIDHRFVSIIYDDIEHEHHITRNVPFATNNYTFPVLLGIKGITAAPSGISGNNLNSYYPAAYGYTGNQASLKYTSAIRSGSSLTGKAASAVNITDMFDATTTQGEILLNYTKLLGLLYVTDPKGNINIMSRNKFFDDYEIYDWTDKVDLSKEYKIQPLTFNTKYYEMKYSSGDTYYENKYSSEFGLDYGEKKINTGYAFKSEPVQLLNSIFTNTLMTKEIKKIYDIKSLDTISYVVSNVVSGYPLPAYFESDGKEKSSTDTKFNLLFKTGYYYQSTPAMYITCDSSVMTDDTRDNGGEYCWYDPELLSTWWGSSDYQATAVYKLDRFPLYSTHYDEYSWDIGYPRISYAGDTEITYPSGSTVYSRFWDSYISEIYNVRNKILTCYVKLSWIDILNFSFKNFVTINGVLYHPNKLLNVNPLSDDPVQVELIQVQNIDSYAEGQIIPGGTVVADAKIKKLRRQGLIQNIDDEE